MKVVSIIQARVRSARLPWKVLLPFDGIISMIEIIMDRLIKNSRNMEIILATSTSEEDRALCRVAANMGVGYFRGPENDVLDRFIQATEEDSFEYIVRICADNPFLDVGGTFDLVNFLDEKPYDYIGYQLSGGVPSIKSHHGLWGEVVSLESLKKTKEATINKSFFEHVTNFVYSQPDMFKIKWVNAPDVVFGRSDIRLTLDDETDFNVCREIYLRMKEEGTVLNPGNIVRFLDKNKPYLSIMKNQIKKYVK